MPLLERDVELAALDAAVTAAVDGRGSALAIIGPAGIGKTGLVTTGVERARAGGLTAVVARGGRMEADLAFGAVRQLFAPLLRAHPDLLELAEPAAVQLLGRGRGGTPGPSDQATVLQALLWTLGDAVERGPLLVVADDVHWWDGPSLRFLGFLARRLAHLPLGLVIATRPPGPDADELATLLADPDLVRLTPSPLSASAVGQLVAERFGAGPEPAFVDACVSAAGGNPFLTHELLAGLDQPDPASISERPGSGARILERLGRLPVEAEALAQAVAVLGASAGPHLAGRLADLDADKVALAADRLHEAGLLTSERPFAFVHPLVRQAVYDGIPPGDRARRHRRAAGLVAEAGAGPGDVAAHLLLTDPAGDPWVVHQLAAAARASSASAPELALAQLLRARAEPPADAGHLLLDTGIAAWSVSDPRAVALLQEAFDRTVSDEQRVGVSALLRSALAETGTTFDVTIAPTRQVLAEATDPVVRLRCLAGVAQSALIATGVGSAAELVAELLDTVPIDAVDVPGDVLAVRAYGGFVAGDSAAAIVAASLRAVDLHRREHPEGIATWFWHAMFSLYFAGAPEAEAAITMGVDGVGRSGNVIPQVLAATGQGWWDVSHGRLLEAETVSRRALELLELGRQPFYRPSPVAVLLDVLLARGEHEAAEQLIEEQQLGGAQSASQHATLFLVRRARLRAATGRWDEAVADLEAVGRSASLYGGFSPAVLPWRSELAEVLHRAGREPERGLALAHEELALVLPFGSARATGTARRVVGLLTQDADALALAITELQTYGDRLAEAATLVDLGGLQRRTAVAEARGTLRSALDLADRVGATVIATRARDELALAGARVHRTRTSGAEALTAAELRTARLAATGATNRDIAQTLFVTVKNVEGQLASTYRKLACGGRAGLAGALRTVGDLT